MNRIPTLAASMLGLAAFRIDDEPPVRMPDTAAAPKPKRMQKPSARPRSMAPLPEPPVVRRKPSASLQRMLGRKGRT